MCRTLAGKIRLSGDRCFNGVKQVFWITRPFFLESHDALTWPALVPQDQTREDSMVEGGPSIQMKGFFFPCSK